MESLIAGLAGFLAGWVIRAMQQPMGPPRGSYGRPRHPGSDNGGPTTPKPEIVRKPQAAKAPDPHWLRTYIDNPVQIAECGGPCTQGAEHCDCGALWNDVFISNPLPYPRIVLPEKP